MSDMGDIIGEGRHRYCHSPSEIWGLQETNEKLTQANKALMIHLRAHGCRHDFAAIASGEADEAIAEGRFVQNINPDPITAMALAPGWDE